MEASKVWAAALGELSLQMTKATYKTWVRPTEALRWEGDCLVVGVANEFTRDWLENRLLSVIERTLIGIVDRPARVRFLVTERLVITEGTVPKVAVPNEAGMIAVKFYEFDPRVPFLQVSKYAEYFWQPLLGTVAYATYRFLRCREKLNEGWGSWRFVSVELLVATVAEGNRQAVTGVQRWTGRRKGQGEKYWQSGAFDQLEQAAIAQIERLGKGKNISYRISCLHSLPLLVPVQVETLPEILQVQHAQFLKESRLDFKEWTQLGLPTLVQE